ncbi:cold-shock protein [Citrobacter amalonaticus]|uniref:Cold-shock protein n=1 Tax=Citrobacter amalonaticus TaxID=35703 RepID=A0A2S4RWB3_CITAM|nr:cold-shock protein [Citrobacter amalonaticus]POT56587.1 cold-shock protein [Citrobacter amalonaticus]POT75113.1 cold-shock protein [Citrobacter amalonaticus]POU64642.1 cold-shock protein [Citrobacter amalonaticus]POV04478.1 cold-shock protein [Citrobacter amalonaticus]
MTLHIHFKCPRCHGSQYRTSVFDVSEKNPFGAKCIFCKSIMECDDSKIIKNKTLTYTA